MDLGLTVQIGGVLVMARWPVEAMLGTMSVPAIEIVEETTKEPICPHCERGLRKVYARRIQSTFGVRFLYFCGDCRKVLGVSHRKGFWMG